MINLKELQEILNSSRKFIYSVELSDFALDRCICSVSFVSFHNEKCDWNNELSDCINDLILNFKALIDPCSTSGHLGIIFTIKL